MLKSSLGKSVLCFIMAFFLVWGSFISPDAATKSNTHYWTCRKHSKNSSDMYITLTAKFSSKKCTDVYFSRSYAHWPNAFKEGSTAKYTTSARGSYTAYSSLITQWASLAFASYTDTIYIYK